MATYKDVDALLKLNKGLLEHAEMKGMYNHARIYERFVNSIEETPTADVVPRAEVEHWKEEANRYQTLWCKTYNDFEIAEFITEAKAEVAREIFAEIEEFHKIIYDRYVFEDNDYAEDDVAIECAMNYGTDVSNMLCELKEKYI